MALNKSEYVRIGIGYRIAAILLCVVNVLVCLLLAVFVQPREIELESIPFLMVPILFFYIFLPILFTGYPPKLLFWMLKRSASHQSDEKEQVSSDSKP